MKSLRDYKEIENKMALNELTIVEAREGLKEKRFSAVELARDCLGAIKKIDPRVKAYVTVDEERVLKESKAVEKKLSELPLGGVPIAVKDNFLTRGLRTTASSRVLENYLPVYDATVISKLKEAGAIILGKTNMDAWAHGSSTETSQFFPTHNPWDLERLPGGSSGGSAAAIAADLTIGAIGSETAGSIRQPASWCGVVGLKPSYGVVSRYGVIAMASSLDSPGPMTKTVEDSRLLFEILRGRDSHDATSVDFRPLPQKPFRQVRIGVAPQYFPAEMDEEVKTMVKEAINLFTGQGLATKEVRLIDPQFAIADYTVLQRAEVSSNLARYDGIRYGRDRSFFGEEAKRRIMLGTYTLSAGYYDAYYLRAEKVRALLCHDFEKVFQEIDVIMAPTTPSTALKLGATKGHPMFGEVQDMLVEASSIAGLPGINLNCGFTKKGLPVGLQIIGPRFSELLLLGMAQMYEKATDWQKRKPSLN
ncbi:MAG TPA: Asp-tRNA(Asn)/Glu-tRNA(Gln) amidotransferase subunit GatA [Patescibacteria group bacterium]|nr:Asp-tRNA(Asn)/Glu-tRNA(Gln) amidotransferase subunit GatA [Patescibacteria group bacterium]